MADLSQFVRYLDRPDVDELVLQTGRPACIRRADQTVPLTKAELRPDHLVAIITRPPLARAVPTQDTAGQPETVQIGAKQYEVKIARRGDTLQVRITEAGAASRPAPAPARSPGSSPGAGLGAHDAGALDPAQLRGGGAPPASAPQRSPAPASAPAPAPAAAPPAASAPAPAAAPRTLPKRPAGAWVSAKSPTDMFAGLLGEARAAAASDVFLVSTRPAMIRINGELLPTGPDLDDAVVRQMLFPLLADRDKQQLETAGYCDFACEVPGAGRLRVNVGRQRTGLKGTFRLVRDQPPTVQELGLPDALTKITRYHQGMIVISGPNGHGKTTTMAALVNLINKSKPEHIITVEDPVELIHPRGKSVITQRQVGAHTHSFEAALKGALREDPDVIVIGELRDRETVEMALSAAETGHLVLATMSTPSGAKTIDRLIDMFPPDDQAQVRATLAGALKLVVSQRLVARADGTGMTAAIELITGNVALWNLIRDNKLFQLPSLLQRGAAYGMIRLEDSLKALVQDGTITVEEAAKWADDPRVFAGGPQSPPDESEPPPQAPGGPGSSAGQAASAIAGGFRNLFGKKGS